MSGARVLHLADYRKRRPGSGRDDGSAPHLGEAPAEAARAAVHGVRVLHSVRPSPPAGPDQVPPTILLLPEARELAMSLGASQGAIDDVVNSAVAFTSWRLVQDVRGDSAWHATAWSLLNGRERSLALPRSDCPSAKTSSAETVAVRWAMTRFVNLLATGLTVSVASGEAVVIPLEASDARPMTRDQWELRTRLGTWPPERDNHVAGTVVVWAHTAAEFRSQRLVARRILTVTRAGHTHDGWLTVPAGVAERNGWQVVSGGESG